MINEKEVSDDLMRVSELCTQMASFYLGTNLTQQQYREYLLMADELLKLCDKHKNIQPDFFNSVIELCNEAKRDISKNINDFN